MSYFQIIHSSKKSPLDLICEKLLALDEETICYQKRLIAMAMQTVAINDFNKLGNECNITLEDPTLTDADVIQSLKMVNFIDDLMNMPFGLDTIMSGQGGNLSGGQIQKIRSSIVLFSYI